jgi:hypothetical protein
MKYSVCAFLLLLVACESSPDEKPAAPKPAATSVAFTCGGQALTLALPCQVGLPLVGTVSAVECSAHAGSKSGVLTLLVDLGAVPNQKADFPLPGPPEGDLGRFRVVKGSLVFSQVDAAKRTFVGRLQDVSLQFESVGACELKDGPFSGVAGNFL